MVKPQFGTQLDWTNPINTGLIGCYIFNEGTGDKVYDLSGNNNTGTLTNMSFPSTPTSGWNPGKFGTVIAFDGTNDYILIGNKKFDYPTLTISAWIRIPNNVNFSVILQSGSENTNKYTFSIYSGSVFVISNAQAEHVVPRSNLIVPLNQYVFVCGITNPETLYVNGILQTATISLPFLCAANTSIGAETASEYYFKGLIDDVRIWNRALIPSEIQTLYTNPYGMFLSQNIT